MTLEPDAIVVNEPMEQSSQPAGHRPKWKDEITLGNVLTIGTMLVGVVLWYGATNNHFGTLDGRVSALETRLDAATNFANALDKFGTQPTQMNTQRIGVLEKGTVDTNRVMADFSSKLADIAIKQEGMSKDLQWLVKQQGGK